MAICTLGALFFLPTIAVCKGLIVGPSVVEVTKEYNDVFPYENFNRNITVPMWDTELLSEKNEVEFQESLDTIANASFLVYDAEFYKVRISSRANHFQLH